MFFLFFLVFPGAHPPMLTDRPLVPVNRGSQIVEFMVGREAEPEQTGRTTTGWFILVRIRHFNSCLYLRGPKC
jgi:hypothetical protein